MYQPRITVKIILARRHTNLLGSLNNSRYISVVDAVVTITFRRSVRKLKCLVEQVCSIRQPIQRYVLQIFCHVGNGLLLWSSSLGSR